MRITEINNNKISVLKKKKAKADGDFSGLMSADEADETEGARTTAGVNSVSSVFSPDSLSVLNNLNDKDYAKKDNLRFGNDLLKHLTDMRNQMMFGMVTETTIYNITNKLKNLPIDVEDDRLSNIIEEIKIRAEVELAKIEMQNMNADHIVDINT